MELLGSAFGHTATTVHSVTIQSDLKKWSRVSKPLQALASRTGSRAESHPLLTSTTNIGCLQVIGLEDPCRATLYDSAKRLGFGKAAKDVIVSFSRDFLGREVEVTDGECSQQANGSDCGVHTLFGMMYHLAEIP